MIYYRIKQRLIAAVCLVIPLSAFAHIIAITPITPFPSTISLLTLPFTASYLVTNVSQNVKFTAIDKSEFPGGSGLSISSNTCGSVLTPGQTCTISVTLNTASPEIISTYLREWAKPTADGMQYPINVQVTSMTSDLLLAGAANGNVYVSANGGANWAPTTSSPNNGTAIKCVSATSNYMYACSGDYIYYSLNGKSWTATTSPDNNTITSLFLDTTGKLYVGTATGNLYYSSNNGASWLSTTAQPDGSEIDSIFVTTSGNFYAGTANGNVAYSSDNGSTWSLINGQPDGTAVTSLYVGGSTLYASTSDEYAYTSTALTGGGAWTLYAQTVHSLFVNSSDSAEYAATQNGYVYSLTTGNMLGFIADSTINGIFQLS